MPIIEPIVSGESRLFTKRFVFSFPSDADPVLEVGRVANIILPELYQGWKQTGEIEYRQGNFVVDGTFIERRRGESNLPIEQRVEIETLTQKHFLGEFGFVETSIAEPHIRREERHAGIT